MRIDFNTHKKFAKLDDGVDDTANKGVIVSDSTPGITQQKELSEEDKLTKVISDALLHR